MLISDDKYYKMIMLIIRKMTRNYQNNRDNKHIKNNIIRGRMKINSGLFEEEFAKMLSKVFTKKVMIYIDQAISYKDTNNRTKTNYPDIMIINNNQIVGIFELKIDLGYSEDSVVDDYLHYIDTLKENGKVKPSYSKDDVIVHKNMKFGLVLLSSGNDHGHLSRIDPKGVLEVLVKDDQHPNDHKLSNMNQYFVRINNKSNQDSWKRLKKTIELIEKNCV